jgi:glutamate decarboxylase
VSDSFDRATSSPGLDRATSSAGLDRATSSPGPGDDEALLRGALERALAYVGAARARSLPVVVDADPEAIAASFLALGANRSNGVPLSLADGRAHDSAELLAAVDATLRLSVHTASPRFFNQNFAGPDPAALAGDWIATALNTTGATFEMAPVFTLMELHLLDRLAALAGLRSPEPGVATSAGIPSRAGLLLAGGSLANLHALQLARHRIAPQVRELGAAAGPRLCVFTSTHAHYSIRKAAQLLGIGSRGVIAVAVDERGRMRADALSQAIAAARADGFTPLAVNATVGTTVVGGFDPLAELAPICAREDVWLHVDGCFGASLLFSPRHRGQLDGIDQADSIAWNLHKMMGVPQQCSALLVRRPEALRDCFAEQADYLFQPDKPYAALDSGDLAFPCARRIDVLKAWLSWKRHGDAGMAARIDRAVENASFLRERIAADRSGAWVSAHPGGPCNVLFWWLPAQLRSPEIAAGLRARSQALGSPETAAIHARLHALTAAIKAGLRTRGQVMLGFSPIDGQPNSFRMLFMNPEVEPGDIELVLAEIAAVGAELGA